MNKYKFNIFEINYQDMDNDYANLLIQKLKDNYKKIMNYFNLNNIKREVIITIWNDKDNYRNYFNEKYNYIVPEWEIARSINSKKETTINIISYRESLNCKGHNNDSLENNLKVIIHEFVHICHFEYNSHNKQPIWLAEALATNLSNQYNNIELKITAELKDIIEGTANYKDYYLMGKYLIDNYPKEYILELSKNSNLLEKETPNIYNETKKYFNKKESITK